MPAVAPRTLFGRIVLVIAMVSIAFQAFAIMVVTQFALVPLGRQATDDFGALMVDAARAWQAADRSERPPLQQRLLRVHRLRVQEPAGEVADFMHVLPYWHLLEAALSARSGQRITLRQTEAADGQTWIWADLPAGQDKVRVGFAADLARLATATQPIGQGRRPALLPETGPAELAVLAREFNRMGAQVEELLANRTTLLAGISHDLRSPLARLRLALGMMSERPDPDLLQRMLHDVDAMNELIARCLDVGRDFSERESVDLDLCELLHEVAAEHGHAGVEIRGHRGPECRMRVRPLALKRILSNLVDNATRYGAGRPVDIEYAVAAGQVEICVLDRGPGIPESEREAVFRPFHRLEASRSSRTGGSGLGLAIVRQIAGSNGWTVELRPRPGGGTAACVRLPLEEGVQAP